MVRDVLIHAERIALDVGSEHRHSRRQNPLAKIIEVKCEVVTGEGRIDALLRRDL